MAVLGGSSGEAIGIPPLPASNYLKGENCMRGVVFVLLKIRHHPVDDALILNVSGDFQRSVTPVPMSYHGLAHLPREHFPQECSSKSEQHINYVAVAA